MPFLHQFSKAHRPENRKINSVPWNTSPVGEVIYQMSLNQIYGALSDPSRRKMLRHLSNHQTATVSELAAPLSIGMPTVLKHLDVLERARLIRRRKHGRTVTVSLVPDAMIEANKWLAQMERFWMARIDRLANMVEKEQS